MQEHYLIEIIIALAGALSLVLWWFFRNVLTKLDELNKSIVGLTVDHGQRITRLEVQQGRRFSDLQATK
jgi:hypothetical protein